MKTEVKVAIRNNSVLLFLVFCFAVFCTLKPQRVHDERSHASEIEMYRDIFMGKREFTLDYPNSLGPLFYMSYGAWSIVNQGSLWVRTLSLICALTTIVLLQKNLAVTAREKPALAAAFLSCPWAVVASMTHHGEIMAMLTTQTALFFLCAKAEKNVSKTDTLLGFAALGATPLVRIYSVFIFPSIAVPSCISFLRGKLTLRQIVWRITALGLAALPLGCLIVHWGGLTSEAFRISNFGQGGQQLSFEWNRLTRPLMLIASSGLYALPWVWVARRQVLKLRRWGLFAAFAWAVAVSAVVPLGAAGPTDSVLRRIVHHTAATPVPFVSVSEDVFWVRLAYAPGLFAGAVLFWLALPHLKENRLVQTLVSGVVFYGLSLPFTGVLYVERYVFPAAVLLMMLGWRLTNDERRSVLPFLPGLVLGLLHATVR